MDPVRFLPVTIGPLAALAVVFGLMAGCSHLAKSPLADDVVAARQMAIRGTEACQAGDWVRAERLFAQAIEVCPVDERSHRRYAEALWRRGAWDAALTHMEQAVRLSGHDGEVLVDLGQMHLQRGHFNRALVCSRLAIQDQPQLAAGHTLQGDAHRNLEKLELALANYHRSLGLQPNQPAVQIAVAEVYQQMGRSQRVLSTLAAVRRQIPRGQEPDRLLLLEGMALKGVRRYADAAERLDQAVQRQPDSVEALYHLSEARLLSGDVALAERTLARALDLAPHDRRPELQQRLDVARRQGAPSPWR